MDRFDIRSTVRPNPDRPMVDIADYLVDYRIESNEAFDTAHYMLLDSLACAAMAMDHPECVKHLGPLVPGAEMKGGARVPYISHELDPVQAAYNIGVQIRWLDFNDTWLAAEWGHPSDDLGAILAVAGYPGRKAEPQGGQAMTVSDVLAHAINAREIQGCYALKYSFNRAGLDHVFPARLASTVVATWMLGGGKGEMLTAVSHSWIDNGALRTCRYAQTQHAGMRIIDKAGPLASHADRDHCPQAMFVVPPIFGPLTAADYCDAVAADPRIDGLGRTMVVNGERAVNRGLLRSRQAALPGDPATLDATPITALMALFQDKMKVDADRPIQGTFANVRWLLTSPSHADI